MLFQTFALQGHYSAPPSEVEHTTTVLTHTHTHHSAHHPGVIAVTS